MAEYLPEKGITYESYVIGITLDDVCADEYMLMTISRMWNIAISIISLAFNSMWNLYHDSKCPSVVIVSNGREFGNKRQSWHYSTTEKTLPSTNKVEHDIVNIDVKYIQNLEIKLIFNVRDYFDNYQD